jgi:hypothetical protein
MPAPTRLRTSLAATASSIPLPETAPGNRALTDVGAAGDLPLPQFQLEVQRKDSSRLTHGHSLSGHRSLLVGGHATRGLVSSAAKLFSTADS